MRERPLIAVYIMASQTNGTLYIGVTSDLLTRVIQHKKALLGGFTADYGCKRLVWFEPHHEMTAAIQREKRLKHWPRAWKLRMINEANPQWRDIADDWFDTSHTHLALNLTPVILRSGADNVGERAGGPICGRPPLARGFERL